MKIHLCVQNSPEWYAARCGKPTASSFDKIFTPVDCKPSSQATGYRHSLLAELMMGKPLEGHQTDAMRRGKELEPEAVAWYEFDQNVEAVAVGFVTNDDGTVGCSPDRLIGEEGLLEIKCPSPQTHISYLLNSERLYKDYIYQVQGQLWLTGRKWADVVAYHPDMPSVRFRVQADEDYIKRASVHVMKFVKELHEDYVKLKATS